MNTPGSGLRSRKRRRGKIDLSELLTRGDSHNSLLNNVLDLSVSMLEASGSNSGQGNTYVFTMLISRLFVTYSNTKSDLL